MGQAKKIAENARDARREKSNRLRRLGRGGGEEGTGYADADAAALLSLIQIATALGGAVSFGLTRTGGAATIRIFLDNDSEVSYVRPSDDLNQVVADLAAGLIEIWQAEPELSKNAPQSVVDAALRAAGA